MKMNNNILVIVEGSKTEKNLLESVLPKYNLLPFKMSASLIDKFSDFDLEGLKSNNNYVYIIQGPRTRIADFLKWFDKDSMTYSKIIKGMNINFKYVYLIYDCDHTSEIKLNEMFEKFSDESDSGLLLLNCPCVEVIGDIIKDEFKGSSFKEYKAYLNLYHHNNSKMGCIDYIINNFNNLILDFLNQNMIDFEERNIMEHPKLLIKKHFENNNIYNKDGIDHYIIRYYTTVIYVMIAQINELTLKIDNYDAVYNYFSNIK